MFDILPGVYVRYANNRCSCIKLLPLQFCSLFLQVSGQHLNKKKTIQKLSCQEKRNKKYLLDIDELVDIVCCMYVFLCGFCYS